MDISLFDYHLPPRLIAQFPSRRRDASTLLVLDRATGKTEIRPFRSICDYLTRGDALVINNTRVFKARLLGKRRSGARVEVFLIRAMEQHATEGKNRLCRWEAIAQPSRRLKESEEIHFGDKLSLTLIRRLEEGKWIVQFKSQAVASRILTSFGHVPLPQYIKRDDMPGDISRYQTVFARKDKAQAVAAPTAGFHFTRSLLERIQRNGIKIVETTLDVGPGTFKPVQVQDINRHTIDGELALLSKPAAAAINRVRNKGGRVVSVGTTTVRTLESAAIINDEIQPFSKEVNIYIKPGFDFKVTDCLLTNFHLPKSSLLILVSAFAGRERILKAYQQAIKKELSFYSYGDAMLIL